MVFNAKQRRAYHSVLSGMTFSKKGNKTIRFLTLTTSDICFLSDGYNKENSDLNNHFQILKKRICRYSPYRLKKEGYITKNQMTRKYGRKNLFKNFNMEYFKVETSEGNGVLHILYRGQYLPYDFLVDNWQDIHLSWDVNIKKIYMDNTKSASCYVVSQYVGGQGSAYVRSSQSWKWVFRGFKSLWYAMKRSYPDRCIELWNNILKERSLGYFYPQMYLMDFG